MEFEFELTAKEQVAFNQVVQGRMDALTKVALGGWKYLALDIAAWIPIGIAVAALVDLHDEYPDLSPHPQTIAIAASIAAALAVGRNIYRRKLVDDEIYLRDGQLTAQSIAVDQAGITYSSPDSSAQLSWPSVREVIEDDATLYLFLSIANAVVLPKRIFRSTDELDQLRRWAKRE